MHAHEKKEEKTKDKWLTVHSKQIPHAWSSVLQLWSKEIVDNAKHPTANRT